MKCRNAERAIYLYPELNDRERTVLDNHLAGCASCRAVFDRVQRERNLIFSSLRVREVPDNESDLTDRIMNGVMLDRRTVTTTRHAWPGLIPSLRWSMAVVSVVLVIMFIAEQRVGITQTAEVSVTELDTYAPRLNSTLFLKSLTTAGSEVAVNGPSLKDCIINCTDPSDPACLDCLTYMKKLN